MEIGRKLSSSYLPIDPFNLRSRVSLASTTNSLVKLSTPLMKLSPDAEGLRLVFTRSLRLGLAVRLGSITLRGISSLAGLEVVLPYDRGEDPERHLGPTHAREYRYLKNRVAADTLIDSYRTDN